jgi:sterol desaturase/sphingolipid hydroxylase (fatty acid hydroxylase superfamily)
MSDLPAADPRLWLLAALLTVLVAATVEGFVLWRRGGYDWRAWGATLGDVIGRRVVEALGLSLAAPVVAWAHAHRVTTLPLDGATAFALLFVGQEFCYYWYHRAAHRVRWFWATHAVHHSSNELNLMAALRLGWTGRLAGTALFQPPDPPSPPSG